MAGTRLRGGGRSSVRTELERELGVVRADASGRRSDTAASRVKSHSLPRFREGCTTPGLTDPH
jgi:hypothetical protein